MRLVLVFAARFVPSAVLLVEFLVVLFAWPALFVFAGVFARRAVELFAVTPAVLVFFFFESMGMGLRSFFIVSDHS